MRLFPLSDKYADHTLCISHKRRMAINKAYNDRQKTDESIFVKVGKQHSTTNPPQDFWCFPGQLLMCCTERNKTDFFNGLFVTVQSVSSERVRVKATGKRPVSLSIAEAGQLRLTHALCYASVQGYTLRDKLIRLLDVKHHNFTSRHLLVGMSRASSSTLVEVGVGGGNF